MATVLIAEPNAYVAELLRMTLESEGYEVETACTRAGVMGHLERRSLSAAPST
jgi:CheY-like chemotaxis protein